MTSLTRQICDCGRVCARMDNVRGRADDLLIVRGINVYSSQIEEVVLGFEEVAPYYRIDLSREGNLDRIEITVELVVSFDGDIDELRDRMADELKSVLAIRPDKLELVPPGGIERQETGKIQRVWDHRESS
jgi:phenylacetate-CoA ligase